MMQTDSASADEDIGDRKEKDAHDDQNRRDGPSQLVLFKHPLLAASRPPHGTRSTPDARRLSFGRAAAIVTTARLPASRSPMARADLLAHIVRLRLTPPCSRCR